MFVTGAALGGLARFMTRFSHHWFSDQDPSPSPRRRARDCLPPRADGIDRQQEVARLIRLGWWRGQVQGIALIDRAATIPWRVDDEGGRKKKEAIASLQLRPAGIKTWLARIPPRGKTGKTCMDHQRQAAALISGAHFLGTRSAPRLLGNPAVSTPTYPSIVSARAAARPTVDGPSINDPKLARVIVTTIFIPSRFCPITLLSHAFVQISLLQNAHRAKHAACNRPFRQCSVVIMRRPAASPRDFRGHARGKGQKFT